MASTTGTVRPVLRLVWPVLLEQVLGLSVGFTDKWLAGNLLEGAEYLAAVGLVASASFALAVGAFGLGMLLIRLPLAVFLARESIVLPAGLGTVPGLGLAAIGAWYAMAADLTVRGTVMLLLFSRKSWSRAAV